MIRVIVIIKFIDKQNIELQITLMFTVLQTLAVCFQIEKFNSKFS